MRFTDEQIDDLTDLFSVAFDTASGDKLRAGVVAVVNAAANIKGHDPRGTRLIVRTVCELFGIGVRHFNRGSERCSNAVSEARFVAAYLLRERFGYSHQAIGAILNRHHSTVMYGAKKVTNDLRLLAIARKAMELLERVDSRSQRMEAA